MTNGTEGGVLHLLRLTRTQCHAWVAFVALRREDGTIEITAVPGAEDESSEWTPETLQGIVRQTLEDPLIGEGRAVIRVSEVFRRYWPGERQYTRMAVAPLNDVSEHGRPWGLLCALDPVDGQFSEAQLDMLGRLAVRFINHLRVRRQFVEDASASEAMLTAVLPQEPPAPRAAVPSPRDEPPEPPEAPSDEGVVRIEHAPTRLAGAEPAPQARPPEAAPRAAAEASETPEPEVAERVAAPEPAGEPAPEAESRAPEVKVVFGEAFSVGADELAAGQAHGASEAAAEGYASALEPAPVEETASVPAEPPAEEASRPLEPTSAGEPVPGTGEVVGHRPLRRVRLSELIDQLDETLSRLGAARRQGALVLVELSTGTGPQPGEAMEEAADRLTEVTRHSDVVLGVGSDMLAVVMELGPRPANLEAIGDRLRAASGTGAAEEALRSSVLRLDPDASAGGEAIVLAAVRGLAGR